MGGRQGRARELQDREYAKLNGLMENTPGSVERLAAALSDALYTIPRLQQIDRQTAHDHVPRSLIEGICDRYWRDWERQNSPMLMEAKPYARRVESAIWALYHLVDEGDAYANDAILILSPDLKLNTAQRLDALEFWAAACTQILKVESPRGRPRSYHLDRTVERLAGLWSDLTGAPFSRTFSPTKPNSNIFKGQSARFVHMLVKAIDPAVTFSEVQTALRKMPIE